MKRFLAFVLSLSFLLLLPSCGRRREPDYTEGDLTKWFDIDLSEFTGGTYYVDLPNEITDEDVQKELRWLQLYYATRGNDLAVDQYLDSPEFTDVAFFYYDVALTPDGESVFSNIFSKIGAQSITIGLWEFPHGKVEKVNALFDNKKFSDALEETKPSGRVTEGVVEEGDIIVLEYSFLNEENVLQESYGNVRIDTDTAKLHLYDDVHPTAILSDLVGKTLGEEHEVKHTFIPEGESEEVTYTYRYKVSYKALETFHTIAITLAEDAFDDSYNDILQGMNGKTVYVRYVLSHYTDFDPPRLGPSFYIDTLGLVTDETDAAKIEEHALASIKNKLQQDRLANEVYPLARRVIFDRLFERDDRVKKLPEEQVDRVYEKLLKEVKDAYEAEKVDLYFAYTDVNDFAAAYFNYSLEEYPTVEDVCRAQAEETVTLRLLHFAVAQLAGIRYSPEKCEEYYVTYLQYQINGYTKAQFGIEITDEERAAIYLEAGEDKTDQLYAELLHLLVKHYAIYEQVTLTLDDVRDIIGSKEDFLFEGLLQITEINVQQYLYENNQWIDTTP